MDKVEDFLATLQPATQISSSNPTTTDDDPCDFLPPTCTELSKPAFSTYLRDILTQSMFVSKTKGWTYHPRSDRHSVLKCFGMLIDLLHICPVLATQIHTKTVYPGINAQALGKTLDLVVGEAVYGHSYDAQQIIDTARILLDAPTKTLMSEVRFWKGQFRPRLTVEAKAIMTDHVGALPRVTDELERFRARSQAHAITVGLVLINTATTFISPGRNGFTAQRTPCTNRHRNKDILRTVTTIQKLPLRANQKDGFDAIIIIPVHCQNDGSPIRASQLDLDTPYENALRHISDLYEARYSPNRA